MGSMAELGVLVYRLNGLDLGEPCRWLGEIISALLHIASWRYMPLNMDG